MTIEIFELDLVVSGALRYRTTQVGVEQELIVRDERSLVPADTTARPLWWTSSINLVAFSFE